MLDFIDDLKELDYSESENATLYKLDIGVFDTVLLVYRRGLPNEESYVLNDMQGQYPTTFEEVPLYDWTRVEDVEW